MTPSPAEIRAARGRSRRNRVGLWVGLAVAAVLIAAGLAAFLLVQGRVANAPIAGSTGAGAGSFASAMQKAGVGAPAAPTGAVDIASVHAVGSHQFSATFTFDEVTALLQAFSYTPTSGQRLALNVSEVSADGDALRLTGNVNAGGSSYRGWIEAPVRFATGRIQTAGAASANLGGLPVTGAQAQQASSVVLSYLNGLMDAAPGLKISSARVTPAGIEASGTAPGSISW